MNLPIIDSFITDNYHASYVWNLHILFEYRSQVSVSFSMNQEIKQLCNIDLSPVTFFGSQSFSSSFSSEHHSSPENNLSNENVSLSSLQGIMNVLCLFILFFSFLYFIILFYETIQNLRLFCFISDVMSFHLLPKPQTASLPSSSSSSRFLCLSLWKQKIQSFVSYLIRSLLFIPERYYLNEFPLLSSLLGSSSFENSDDSIASSSEKKVGESCSSSFQLCRLAPSDLYDYPGIPKKEKKSFTLNPAVVVSESNSERRTVNDNAEKSTVIPPNPENVVLRSETEQEEEARIDTQDEKTPARKFLSDWKSLSFKVKVCFFLRMASSFYVSFVFFCLLFTS
jgi:hypothetical protein